MQSSQLSQVRKQDYAACPSAQAARMRRLQRLPRGSALVARGKRFVRNLTTTELPFLSAPEEGRINPGETFQHGTRRTDGLYSCHPSQTVQPHRMRMRKRDSVLFREEMRLGRYRLTGPPDRMIVSWFIELHGSHQSYFLR